MAEEEGMVVIELERGGSIWTCAIVDLSLDPNRSPFGVELRVGTEREMEVGQVYTIVKLSSSKTLHAHVLRVAERGEDSWEVWLSSYMTEEDRALLFQR